MRICCHCGAMVSTKKLVLEDRFEAYNLPLGCISHAIRAQAGGLPGALSKVGLDIFVEPPADTTMLDIGALRHGLSELLGVTVDVVTPMSLPDKFRDSVLAAAVPI